MNVVIVKIVYVIAIGSMIITKLVNANNIINNMTIEKTKTSVSIIINITNVAKTSDLIINAMSTINRIITKTPSSLSTWPPLRVST